MLTLIVAVVGAVMRNDSSPTNKDLGNMLLAGAVIRSLGITDD